MVYGIGFTKVYPSVRSQHWQRHSTAFKWPGIHRISHFSRLKFVKFAIFLGWNQWIQWNLSVFMAKNPSETTETRPHVAVAPAPHLGSLALPGGGCIWASGKTDLIWLVVDLPLWKIWTSVGITIPNMYIYIKYKIYIYIYIIYGKIKHVPNHQPV